MPITANYGGVLRELETVTVNESGVLYELDTVHANGAGVLYEVHSAVYFPDSLTWRYGRTDASAYKPTVSDNGLTVSNTYSSIVCNYVVSDVFEIKGSIKITVSYSHQNRYSNGSGGFNIFDENLGENVGGFSLTSSGSKTETYNLTTGKYHIGCGGSSGSQSGSGANNYTISISFSK